MTATLRAWKQRHADWYGVDAAMTKASHEIDRQIRANGVLSVGSKEYFDAIDRAMGQKYPDRMGGTPQTAGIDGGTQNTATRGRIARSVAEGYRRMGIDVDDPEGRAADDRKPPESSAERLLVRSACTRTNSLTNELG